MRLQVRKWGNSLGIRIPQSIANQINIQDGSKINLVLKNNKIELIPVVEDEFELSNLVSLITDENLHCEIFAGETKGKEVW
ncbi:MAG TPA: AbrB/MazE/SpoVT family DNA-binding domain-containing protein [Candidatus Kapabacteria bacterium]|nr:AbrB/MazE/SpoVT family DNA-binding domain-containing protein [Candidatus Kapabacteria bacterium]HPP39555.1 AbrB/MazE/SpoVT family DNA-binding domain-containing protein [Candidatus Kapabacteria bacterium]